MIRLLMALVCAVVMASQAMGAATYKAVPEVVWFSYSFNGKHAGFGRGEFGKGEVAPYEFQNIIILNLPQRRIVERTWWEFTPDLKPAAFYHKFVAWQAGQSVTNIYDGTFDYKGKKLECAYQEYGAQEKFELPLPKNPISLFTQTLFLARRKLAPGQKFSFQTFSYRDRRFVTQEIKVVSWDAGLKAWLMEARSEQAPGTVSRLWFQTASKAHPNGWTVKSEFPGPSGVKIEMKATSRAEAVEGFEKEARVLGI